MIRYRKGRCPAELAAFAATPGADWNGFMSKQQAREAVVADQRSVCAYCQRRIRADLSMKLDHWIARSHPVDGDAYALDWTNLVGACAGATEDVRHCDTSRGDRDPSEQHLYLHPVEGRGPDPRQHLRYQADGTAYDHPPDPRVDRDIAVLNLNADILKRNRAAALAGLEHILKRRGFTPRHLQDMLVQLDARPVAEKYVDVARDYLTRKLRRLS